jgi:ribosomal protein S3
MGLYAGIEIRSTSATTSIEIRIMVTEQYELKAKDARRLGEIISLIQKRYNFNDEDNKYETALRLLEKDRALFATSNVGNLKLKLLSRAHCKMAVNKIMGFVMRRNPIGCELIVSGSSESRSPEVRCWLPNNH